MHFFNENVWTPIKISLKFVPKGPINNIPALVQIMAWRRPGNKPLSEPMMVRLPTHICVTRPQWVKIKVVNTIATFIAQSDSLGKNILPEPMFIQFQYTIWRHYPQCVKLDETLTNVCHSQNMFWDVFHDGILCMLMNIQWLPSWGFNGYE